MGLRRWWHVVVYGPRAINRNVSAQAGISVRAWTRWGAEAKTLQRYGRYKPGAEVVDLHVIRGSRTPR